MNINFSEGSETIMFRFELLCNSTALLISQYFSKCYSFTQNQSDRKGRH